MKQETFPLGKKELPLKFRPILEHARLQILQSGIRTFTIEKLAGDLRISKKTIYKIFSAKEKFVETVLLYHFEELFTKVRQLPDHPEEPLKQILLTLNIILRQISLMASSTMYEVKLYYPQVWQRTEDFQTEVMKNLFNGFKKARQMGLIRKSLKLDFIAGFIMQTVQMVFQPEFFINYSYTVPEMVRMFIDLFMNGMMENGQHFDISTIEGAKYSG
jgi:AcrR family transcriptional regulator